MQKLAWRLKLEADRGDGSATEIEVGGIEREDWANPETLGLSLGEAKRLSAAVQAEIVRSQAAIMGEHYRCCRHCGCDLSSKGYRQATFRSLFGEAPLRVRRFQICARLEVLPQAPRSFSALGLEGGVAPELAYVTAKCAALAPFGKVAEFLVNCCPSVARSTPARCAIGRAGSASASRGCVRPEPQIPTSTP